MKAAECGLFGRAWSVVVLGVSDRSPSVDCGDGMLISILEAPFIEIVAGDRFVYAAQDPRLTIFASV